MEFVKNITTNSESLEFLIDLIPDRVFVFNKDTDTIYEKYNNSFVPVGSKTSYEKGEKALHYEGAKSKVSELPKNPSDGSVFYIENDTTTYSDRVVNSLFIKWPEITGYYEVKLNTYTKGEVDNIIIEEKEAREAADSDLQDNINTEAEAREDADEELQSNIDSEATSRAEADATLQDNIDTEAGARESADETLQSNIDTETSNRESADSTLQGNIDAEAEAREEADGTIQGNIDSLEERVEQNEADLEIVNWNIDFETSSVLQYAGEVTTIPSDISSFKVGTTWKITEDFVLNEKNYKAGTFVFKDTDETVDIYTGAGSSGAEEVENLKITSDNKPTWVGNYFLGNTSSKGKYIIFNKYSSTSQTFSFGHFLLKGPVNVYNFDLMVNYSNNQTQNLVTSGGAPCSVYTCSIGENEYYAIYIDSNENFDVYYTGWISDNFESFNYTQGDLSNFSKLALGELDLDNLPKGSNNESIIPHFKYTESAVGQCNFKSFVDSWDFEKYPICYLQPQVFGSSGQAAMFSYISNYIDDNITALSSVLNDETKPVYLILDKITNLNLANGNPSDSNIVNIISKMFNGTAHPWPGLIGLVMPQDDRSDWAGNDYDSDERLFICNFPNLKYLRLNPRMGIRNNGKLGAWSCVNLPKLESISIPTSVTTLIWGEKQAFDGCSSLTNIYLPHTSVVYMDDIYGTIAREFYFRENSAIYVDKSLLSDYLLEYSPSRRGSGFLMGKFRTL